MHASRAHTPTLATMPSAADLYKACAEQLIQDDSTVVLKHDDSGNCMAHCCAYMPRPTANEVQAAGAPGGVQDPINALLDLGRDGGVKIHPKVVRAATMRWTGIPAKGLMPVFKQSHGAHEAGLLLDKTRPPLNRGTKLLWHQEEDFVERAVQRSRGQGQKKTKTVENEQLVEAFPGMTQSAAYAMQMNNNFFAGKPIAFHFLDGNKPAHNSGAKKNRATLQHAVDNVHPYASPIIPLPLGFKMLHTFGRDMRWHLKLIALLANVGSLEQIEDAEDITIEYTLSNRVKTLTGRDGLVLQAKELWAEGETRGHNSKKLYAPVTLVIKPFSQLSEEDLTKCREAWAAAQIYTNTNSRSRNFKEQMGCLEFATTWMEDFLYAKYPALDQLAALGGETQVRRTQSALVAGRPLAPTFPHRTASAVDYTKKQDDKALRRAFDFYMMAKELKLLEKLEPTVRKAFAVRLGEISKSKLKESVAEGDLAQVCYKHVSEPRLNRAAYDVDPTMLEHFETNVTEDEWADHIASVAATAAAKASRAPTPQRHGGGASGGSDGQD